MSIYNHFQRQAEGLTVAVSEPAPRRVTITKDAQPGGYGLSGLSIQEAEGLLYALQAALADAKSDDAK